jgi:aminopeptidase N
MASTAFAARSMLIALALVPTAAVASTPVVEHTLEVQLTPAAGGIAVRDHIVLPSALPAGHGGLTFTLHPGLEPSIEAPAGASLEPLPAPAGAAARYRLRLPAAERALTLRYRGTLADAIQPQGVFLSGADAWYPRLGDERVRFSLAVTLPSGWSAVSQGRAGPSSSPAQWVEEHPQEEIYLAAGRFTVYRRASPVAEALVYLRKPDETLARRYLDATPRYLEAYSRLIGPYPYAKFALVENFQQTGYGMPSFTLLGSQVIRLPFIVHTSYPHEILHNWWGNGVYVDYAGGNWSEGLTAYLADYRIAAEHGHGAEYRRDALQKYRSYVHDAKDFPLRAFRGGHRGAMQAIGYDKALMVFHMLRRRIGDEAFFAGLRGFYREWCFRRAGWDDLRRAFETASGEALEGFFRQWLDRSGAPALALADVHARGVDGAYRVTGTLRQTQPGPAYRLRVPVVVQLAQGQSPWRGELDFDGKHLALDLSLPAAPLRLQVDPDFELFRRLAPGEIPPSLGELFGRGGGLFVLPAGAPETLRARYRALAAQLGAGKVVSDAALSALPAEGPVWLLGWDNRFRSALANALAHQDVAFNDTGLMIAGHGIERAQRCAVLVARRAHDAPIAWLACEDAAAFAGLARKLPHYGKYGYLAFAGEAPTNVLKGQWTVSESPLSVTFTATAEKVHPSVSFR